MKYLLFSLIFIFILFSCIHDAKYTTTDPNTLLFHLGDNVHVKKGFYSKCPHGYVVGYINVKHLKNLEEPNLYSISLFCNNLMWVHDDVTIEENNLELIK